MDRRPTLVAAVVILGACGGSVSDPDTAGSTVSVEVATSTAVVPPATSAAGEHPITGPTTEPTIGAITGATTRPPTSRPARSTATTGQARTDASSTMALSTSSLPTTTSAPLSTNVDVVGSTGYMVPVREPAAAGWGPGHSGYPATDIFSACGAELVSPVDGAVLEVRTVDGWDPAVDNPATRGGRSVSIRGDDGVRYYLAHLDEVDPALIPGGTVAAGRRLGTVGLTGRTSGCHVHFGISPPCPGPEWSVRRGVVEPAGYLDDWRAGARRSPADEVAAWGAANPDACDLAMADPFAADS